jgi:23S rRNA pseudouridine1911/1915/1917 synthase
MDGGRTKDQERTRNQAPGSRDHLKTVHTRTLTADRGDSGVRLDIVIRRHLADVAAATRTRVQAWIEDGRVTINGNVVSRVSRRAAYNDIVTVRFTDAARRRPAASDAREAIAMLDVLYEDAHLLALNKPAGVVVHPTYRHAGGTLMNALLWHAREWPEGHRPSLVGRLDKLTSGILIVAKSPAAHAALQREMTSSRSEKDYLAVVFGRVNTIRGSIDCRLIVDRNDRRRMIVSTVDGIPSLTRFVRISRGTELSLLRCRLVTGRRHQIRVHLAARGWPIVGDASYGTSTANKAGDWTFPRQALHAWRVAFAHPVTGERVALEAPLPLDMKTLIAEAGLSLTSNL